MASSNWAISQISQLLPLDEESLQEIINYSLTLSKNESAEHLKNLLGDDPKTLEFISSFNSRREAPAISQPASTPSRSDHQPQRQRKKKAPLNRLPPPRQPDDYGNTIGAYSKKDEEHYIPGSRQSRSDSPTTKSLGLVDKPEARQLPVYTSKALSKPPPSASGSLISDLPNVRTSSRTSSPSKTKINISGGPSMHGASSTIQDLDSAIRTLELQTNHTLSSSPSARRCDCLATRHPLLAAAPNCLNCGKIVCVKEGIGPCTFCAHPLLSPSEITSMIQALREERGQEKMAFNNAAHRRADVSQTPRAFATPSRNDSPGPVVSSSSAVDATLDLARQHRDKLLAFQNENARRTHVIDEAADFETPTSGQSIWSSPVERAAQLKMQQKVLREQEWNAKPEYEKKRIVVSVDLVGGKVVRKMADRERPVEKDEMESNLGVSAATMEVIKGGNGAFSNNPLLGSLIRPVWKGKDTERDGEDKEKLGKTTWRRVQDEDEDNEAWILDGGVYGGREGTEILAANLNV